MPFIYCSFNECFRYYGDDVHKLGRSCDPTNRFDQVTTFFLNPIEILHQEEVKDDVKAEQILFNILRKERISKNREFFRCPFEKIKKSMKLVQEIVNNDKEYTFKQDKFCEIPVLTNEELIQVLNSKLNMR